MAVQGEGGKREVVARRNDSISSLAQRHGHSWETIWDDPDNQELREQRADPDVLQRGDRIVIPPLRVEPVDAATGQRHRFRRKGIPAKLRVYIKDHRGDALADVPYELRLGSEWSEGTTDAEGLLEAWVDPAEQDGLLRVWADAERSRVFAEWPLGLGALAPHDTVSGVQERLANLGRYEGPIDGELNPDTQAALRAFQAEHELDATGELDDATCQQLDDAHGAG